MKCHDSPLYSCASLDSNISVTGDEDGFVKMWDNRQGDTIIMTCKRFDEFVSSFLNMDEHHLITASGDLRDLRQKKPDIQPEMYDGEMNCVGNVRSGTKLVVGRGLILCTCSGNYCSVGIFIPVHGSSFPKH